MDYSCSIPVLLIGFNRPDTIQQVFNSIKNAKPKTLYITIDAARDGKEGERYKVEQVKDIVKNVDWGCTVYRKYNEINLGAEITISSAIKWAFEKEEYLIIIEDDIVVPISFFKFEEEMLIKYKDDNNICIVSGNNFTPLPTLNNEDYFFCHYGHSWGWGTWKREVNSFNLNTEILEEHCKYIFTKTITNSKGEAKYYARLFKNLRAKGIGNCTWDFIGLYNNRINRKLAIVPRVNLATNIGVEGLHARGKTKYHFVPADCDFVVVNHPKSIECWDEYDKYHFKHHFPRRRTIIERGIRFIIRHIKNGY